MIPARDRPDQIRSDQIRSDQIRSDQIRSDQTDSIRAYQGVMTRHVDDVQRLSKCGGPSGGVGSGGFNYINISIAGRVESGWVRRFFNLAGRNGKSRGSSGVGSGGV